MKISIEDLKRTASWLEANSRDVMVQITSSDGNRISFKCLDRYENEVEITLYENGQMMPKIRRTELLK